MATKRNPKYSVDNCGRVIFDSEDQLLEAFMCVDDLESLTGVILTDADKYKEFHTHLQNQRGCDERIAFQLPSEIESEQFHLERSKTWLNADMTVNDMLRDIYRDVTEIERARLDSEILLFDQMGMLEWLVEIYTCMKIFKKNNIVWGVGRGSSVASYVLYRLGVHRVDSIKYNLDIREFLREED
jgi:DNA polymerase III alpha subunit